MTLTHNCDTPWAQAATTGNNSLVNGLTGFGRAVVKEMNRLGMLVDISHVADQTMRDVLSNSRSPVIFSHSGARAISNHVRNVPDDVLDQLVGNGGIVMVVFYTVFVDVTKDAKDVNVSDVVRHVNYIKERIGVDYVGIGSDYDGVSSLPVGLEDAGMVMNLTVELVNQGYRDDEIVKVIGGNLLRVLKGAESVRNLMAEEGELPSEDICCY